MFQRESNSHARAAMLVSVGLLVALAAQIIPSQSMPANAQAPAAPAIVPSLTPYIDVHSHIDRKDIAGSIESIVKALPRQNATEILVLSEPWGPNNPDTWEMDPVLAAAKKYPGKVAVAAGGGSLNGMILQSYTSHDAGPEVQRKFKERAEDLLRKGAVGFGELSTGHLSLPSSPVKDYEYAPADHPLLLMLADMAAERGVPIDIHMEAVTQTIPLPAGLQQPANPPQLPENIAAFERLLKHNPRAKIIWAHAGGDFTGYRTPDLCRRLLAAHPNLYMEIKVDPASLGKNPVVAADGKIKPDWLKLFQDFPNQFVIGSDQHYGPNPPTGQTRWQAVVNVLNQLPADLRRKIGMDNALRLYPAATTSSSAVRP